MFSGIVEGTGSVASLDGPQRRNAQSPLIHRLSIRATDLLADVQPGASVAVNGVCLTLVEHKSECAEFDVVAETMRRTNLGRIRRGDPVNLERSLRPLDRIDGHIMQGHVDATGILDRIERQGGEHKLWITTDDGAMRYVIPKGSIALDGVSLTVVDVRDGRFSVVLIPTTLERTTFGKRREGDSLNIETDIISRTVVHTLQRMSPGEDESLRQRLIDGGFVK